MAQEISITVTSSITLSGQTASGTTNFKLDLAGDYLGEEQTIDTTSTALSFGDMVAAPKSLYVRNLDATNYVEIDESNSFNAFPQKIPPGGAILLLPQTLTIYGKANTAAVKVWIVAG